MATLAQRARSDSQSHLTRAVVRTRRSGGVRADRVAVGFYVTAFVIALVFLIIAAALGPAT